MTATPATRIGLLVLFLVCLFPLVSFAIWPEDSLGFVLAASPSNDWLGFLYSGYIIAGFFGVISIAERSKIGLAMLFLVCLLPLVTFAIRSESLLRFVLADSPLYGWFGSLYGGYIIAGFLGVIGIAQRLLREWGRSFDWSRFERSRLYRILKFIDDRFVRLFLLVFLAVALILIVAG